jgi:PAS domain S-box-containing protein
LDRELRVKTANQSFYETFRVSAEQTLKRSIYELGNGQWSFPKLRQTLDILQQGSVEYSDDIEVEHDFENIGRRVFRVSARSLRREEKLILVALEDYTERKRAAEARYRRLFEAAKDAIVVIDAETGEITDVNPHALELFGCERKDLVGKRFWEPEPLSGIPGADRALEWLRDREVVRFPVVTIRRRDGRRIETELIGNLYQEGAARVIQFNIRDITERIQFQQQLQQTAKLESLGVLAGGIAHDFNNLLVGIMGNASLALSSAPADTPYQQALREVVEASHRAADLTRQMLAYAGKGRFVVRPVDISELVEDIRALLRTSAPKSVELEFDLEDDLPLVVADATQLQQVIMNLVINGAEAIGEGKRGSVRITASKEQLRVDEIRRYFLPEDLQPGTYVSLEITDSGAGMDEVTQARIFDPFFTTKFTGRGLGLAAVQGIVRGHLGAIRVTSTPGQGSTFRVLLPAADQAARVPRRSKTAAPDLQGGGLVLVVDDDDIVLRLAKSALERYGYQVMVAENGEVALQLIRQRGQELNLVILDLTMPVMGGEEALPHIKALRPDLPVLLASGYDAAQALARFGNTGLAGFVQKPFTAEKLASVVKDTLAGDP